jgi:hypothetical protein
MWIRLVKKRTQISINKLRDRKLVISQPIYKSDIIQGEEVIYHNDAGSKHLPFLSSPKVTYYLCDRGSCWNQKMRHTPAGTNHEPEKSNPTSGNRRLLQRQMKLSSGVRLMLNRQTKTGARESLSGRNSTAAEEDRTKARAGIWPGTEREEPAATTETRSRWTTHRKVAQAKIGSHRSPEAKRKTEQHRQTAKTILLLKSKHDSHAIIEFTALAPSFWLL